VITSSANARGMTSNCKIPIVKITDNDKIIVNNDIWSFYQQKIINYNGCYETLIGQKMAGSLSLMTKFIRSLSGMK